MPRSKIIHIRVFAVSLLFAVQASGQELYERTAIPIAPHAWFEYHNPTPFPALDAVTTKFHGRLSVEAVQASYRLRAARTWLLWSAETQDWPIQIRGAMNSYEAEVQQLLKKFLEEKDDSIKYLEETIIALSVDYELKVQVCELRNVPGVPGGPWVSVSVRTVRGQANVDVGGFFVFSGPFFRPDSTGGSYTWPLTSDDPRQAEASLILAGSPIKFWAKSAEIAVVRSLTVPTTHRYEAIIHVD